MAKITKYNIFYNLFKKTPIQISPSVDQTSLEHARQPWKYQDHVPLRYVAWPVPLNLMDVGLHYPLVPNTLTWGCITMEIRVRQLITCSRIYGARLADARQRRSIHCRHSQRKLFGLHRQGALSGNLGRLKCTGKGKESVSVCKVTAGIVVQNRSREKKSDS